MRIHTLYYSAYGHFETSEKGREDCCLELIREGFLTMENMQSESRHEWSMLVAQDCFIGVPKMRLFLTLRSYTAVCTDRLFS